MDRDPSARPPTARTIDRRAFLMSASASALMLGWHDAIGALASDTPRQANSVAQGAYRIRELRLSTAIPLARMATYYREVLGFGVKRPTEGTLVVQAGTTKLRFTRSDASDEETPWYHFAFDAWSAGDAVTIV